MNKIVTTLLIVCLSATVFAQSNTSIKLSGKITDANTTSPVVGASVLLTNTKAGTKTDVDGNFLSLLQRAKFIQLRFRALVIKPKL